jgi:hypothetical protein
MIIVDDPLIWFHGKKWCHMTSTINEEELHEFAQKIGLRRSWYQNWKFCPHYDLTESIREQAIRKGAIPVDGRYLIINNFRPHIHFLEKAKNESK